MSVVKDDRDSPLLVDPLHRRVDLSGTWQTAVLTVVSSTDEIHAISDPLVYLRVSCTGTSLRETVLLAPTDRGLEATVELVRDDIVGLVDLQAEVVTRFEDGWRNVGTSQSWVVVTQLFDAPVKQGAPPFPMVWVNFTDTSAPEVARRSPSALGVMDLSTAPTLLLNRGIDGLEALLTADKAQLERRRMRDVVSSYIARDALAALFRAAAGEVIALSDSEPNPPQSHIYRQVCQSVADEMRQVSSVEQLYEQLIDVEQHGGGQRAILWSDVDGAIDRLSGVAEATTRATAEVRSV